MATSSTSRSRGWPDPSTHLCPRGQHAARRPSRRRAPDERRGADGESRFDGRRTRPNSNPGDTLTYAWDFTDNGSVDATTSTTSFTYTAASAYAAKLRHRSRGRILVHDQDVSANNSARRSRSARTRRPAPSTWSATPTWFSGGATRSPARRRPACAVLVGPDDPPLHDADDLPHARTSRPGPGVTSGNFNAPDHDYPSFLTLTATVTDAGGLQPTGSGRARPEDRSISAFQRRRTCSR